MIMKGMGIYQLLASVFFGGMILHFAGPFLIPLAYAFLIAVVLFPICAYFESKGFGKVLSIVFPLIILFIFFSVLVLFLSYELVILSEKWPMIQAKLDPMLNQIQQQLEIEFGWTAEKQLNWIRGYLVQMSQNTGAYLKETANAIFSALFNLIIIPIYVSLILVYRRSLVRFVIDISAEHYRAKMKEVILETVKVFSGFIRGMVTVYIVVGILNSFGLVDHWCGKPHIIWNGYCHHDHYSGLWDPYQCTLADYHRLVGDGCLVATIRYCSSFYHCAIPGGKFDLSLCGRTIC
jgi:predicted PurR-regulated permease PerM